MTAHLEKWELKLGDKVLVFNSKHCWMPGKLRSRWMGPYSVIRVFDYGVVELSGDDRNFKVNMQRVKPYLGADKLEVLSVDMEFSG